MATYLTPAKAISKASYKVKAGNAAAERVLEILNTESPLADVPNAKTKTDFTSEINLNNISFKYEDELVSKKLFTYSAERKKCCPGRSIRKWKKHHCQFGHPLL
jgi:subfamily B ATP-binding cassette protein MsbA